ncbi:response regulator transcription factor [Cohnella sp. 56]|uniref:response regulator transcription factor n=1 Tax=Cohnella sp. 56 TaxID=3113722 RepID=UPI0030EA8413
MARILIVDDDPNIRELLGHFLNREGFETQEAGDGKEALAVLDEAQFDLVILDIMMPNMDGWALCKELRSSYELPVLMLTAMGETAQKVKGFELGTDDYMVKPFEPAELVVRVKALLRRYKIAVSHQIQIGRVQMNRQTFELLLDDQPHTLPLKEFELLFKLASHPGQTFSRDQIIEQIWGFDYEGDERTVDVHIRRLRERFPDECGFRITTIRGLGYRLEVLS